MAETDKQIKTAIIHKIFKTTSKTEIEKMLLQVLNYRRQDLEELFKELEAVKLENPLSFINNYNNRSVDF